MSFNFGNLNTPCLGTSSTPENSGAFANFSFGAQPVANPGFSSTSSTSALGIASSAPGFGTTTTTPGFGATLAAPPFGLSVCNAATSAPPTLGGFGGCSATTQQAPGVFSGFQDTSGATGKCFGGFGTTTTASEPSFGGFGTSGPTNINFSTPFGLSFGKPAASVPPALCDFDNTFKQQQQQPQRQIQQCSFAENFAQTLFQVSLYGDERDEVIAKWNFLQAKWGMGKAYYSPTAEPIEFTPENILCMFKGMTYNPLPTSDDKSGLVCLDFNKTQQDVEKQQNQIIVGLNQIFGSRPNLMTHMEDIIPLSDTETRCLIYLEEKLQPCGTKRILATELSNFLNQPNLKPQLTNIGITAVTACIQLTQDQLQEYCNNPPQNINPSMWKQAIINNPDPMRLLHVPMIGFNDLKFRMKIQDFKLSLHNHYLLNIQKDLLQLKEREFNIKTKINQYETKSKNLNLRILQVIIKQESTRKIGMALSPKEEILRAKLEYVLNSLSTPMNFKCRLMELLAHVRKQHQLLSSRTCPQFRAKEGLASDLCNILRPDMESVDVLMEMVKQDMKSLQIISDGMEEISKM